MMHHPKNENLNVTKWAIYNEKIIGFTTLLTDTLLLKNIKEDELKKEILKKLKLSDEKKLISAVNRQIR